jgi:hypothetical protein
MGFVPSDIGDEGSGSDSSALFREIPSSVASAMAMDKLIRQMFTTCWILMPKDRQTVGEFEKEIRRLVDRALKNLRDDCEAFSIDPPDK